MHNLEVSIALGHSDRHVALVDGSVKGAGRIHFVGQTIQESSGTDRHERILAGEFVAAEMSLASYVMAVSRGADLTAVPFFPRRLFCHSLIFVRSDSKLRTIDELRDTRIGINSFQTTLAVQLRGDLAALYAVPWQSITWITETSESVPFVHSSADVRSCDDLGSEMIHGLLLDGELDAVVHPHPSRTLMHSSRIRRLLADPIGAERAYFAQQGHWPIMHLVALRGEAVRRDPSVPACIYDVLMTSLDEAQRHYLDPNWSMLPWGRLHYEDATDSFGEAFWRNGLTSRSNQRNLQQFLDYCADQGLTPSPLELGELFCIDGE
jgi:4,5-dihydroxyphthalate decarboxylase